MFSYALITLGLAGSLHENSHGPLAAIAFIALMALIVAGIYLAIKFVK